MERTSIIVFFSLILFSFFSCESWNEDCTDVFREITLNVLSVDEEPIVLDQITVANLETGRVLEICDGNWLNCKNGDPAGYAEEGIYTIFHDGLRDEISGEKSKILVEGSNKEASFEEEFVIGDNGCHVFKAAGPDTVFVEVN